MIEQSVEKTAEQTPSIETVFKPRGRRGMPGGKPEVEAETPPEPVTEDITYLPGPSDPPMVKWGGHVFHANKPKTVSGHAAGTPSQRANADLIQLARKNRFFKVGAFDPRDAVPAAERVVPATPEQYRAHAAAWLKTMQSVDELDKKWVSEEPLRLACEVGTDDLEYLMTLFNPKRAELRKLDMV